jgi:WD40 repeat protein
VDSHPQPLTDREVGELARVFHIPVGARQVLTAAGLPPGRQPNWQDLTAEEFWREVNSMLGAGVLPDGRDRIIAAARHLYPANPVFAGNDGADEATARDRLLRAVGKRVLPHTGLVPDRGDATPTADRRAPARHGLAPPFPDPAGSRPRAGAGTSHSPDRDALSRRVAATADDLRARDPTLARRLGVAAYRIAATTAAGHAVLSLFGPTPLATLTGHTLAVASVVFSPDGRTLATASDDGTARLWDISTATQPRAETILTGHTSRVLAAAFSPDGHILATAGYDTTARLWDVTQRHDPPAGRTLAAHTNWVGWLAFTPDGRTLATTGADASPRLWDVADPGQPSIQATLTGHADVVRGLAWSPDGRTLATASFDRTARLWDVTNLYQPRVAATLTGHTGWALMAAFSPDGRILAVAGADQTTRLWDVSDLRRPRTAATLTGHAGFVHGVAFSPDGHMLATASYDKTARLWDVTDPHEPRVVATLTGHTDIVGGTAFSPDGRVLATASSDTTAQLWDIDPAQVVARACRDPVNQLSPAEWETHIPELPYTPPCDQTGI